MDKDLQKNRKAIKIRELFTSRLFLILIAISVLCASFFIWYRQINLNYDQLTEQTISKLRLYSSETELRFNRLYRGLVSLSEMELDSELQPSTEWTNAFSSLLSSYKGINKVIIADSTMKIRVVIPSQDSEALLNKKINSIELSGLTLWQPITNENGLIGFLVGIININDFIVPIISDIENDYKVRITDEDIDIYFSDTWGSNDDANAAKKIITLQNADVWTFSIAPTIAMLNNQIQLSLGTLWLSLLFSFITLLSLSFAQRISKKSKLLELNKGELQILNTQLEGARNEAERANLAKSEFLSRMSHELRTPLNSILGFSQLLLMDELTPDQTSSLGQILISGKHLLDLINEVLDISRIEAGKMDISSEPVQLAETLREAIELIRPLAAQRGISIVTRLPSARDIFVTADTIRLKQVILNLLSNAVKYNRESGKIVVAADLQTDGYLHISVQDTGEGIPPEKMKRLFTPFDRLGLEPDKVEGTGLGLALSKGLVEAMGGRIGADSVVGQGSNFWVDLQLTMAQKEDIVMAVVDEYVKENPLSKKGLVLYVEDNLSNIQLIEKVLTRIPGVDLITAMQGSIALDLARLHTPVLILLDLHLPDMHGEKVLQQLRAMTETKDIPVIIVSADATKGQIEHMLSVGATAYLTKPIDVKEFIKIVGVTLEAVNQN